MSRPDADSQPRAQMRTGRMEAFSDGVFAIAVTLLVLDIAVPPSSAGHLLRALGDQWAVFLAYAVSFATIGAAWLAHNIITECLVGANAVLLRLNLLFLLVVSFLPFPTRLVAEYVHEEGAERVAVTFYGIAFLAVAVMLSVLWRYAVHARLVHPRLSDTDQTELTRRLTPGLGGYAALVVLGLFLPTMAVVGYLLIAFFLILPIPTPHRRRR